MTSSPPRPSVEFLQLIPAEYVSEVLKVGQPQPFAPGAVLFREGTIHPFFHILELGSVRLDMAVPGRGRIPMLTIGPGDVLAWSALVAEGVMTSTAVALEPVTTLAFDGIRLRQLCSERPEIGYHVMKQVAGSLSRRLVATRLQLLDIFSADVPVLDVTADTSPVDHQC
jgi:CRP-like cAMP-binding protein